jgi:DNA-binding transcriptional LysR family regulator
VLTIASDFAAVDLGQVSARAGLGLHQLRYIMAAAQLGGFRRAARHLGVQQSAVSRRIQELEDRLGAPLFERGPHGVRLTSAGEDFVRGAQRAMGKLDLAVDRVSEVARLDHHSLRVGVLSGLGGGALQDLLRRLVAAEPGLGIELVEGESCALDMALTHGRLDVALLLSKPRKLATRPAWRERVVVAIPAEDGLSFVSSVTWADLRDRPLLIAQPIVDALSDQVVRRLGSGPAEHIARASAPASVARLVALGQGLGLVNENDACRVTGVAYRPLARTFLNFDAVLGRRPEKPIIRRLLGLLPAAT